MWFILKPRQGKSMGLVLSHFADWNGFLYCSWSSEPASGLVLCPCSAPKLPFFHHEHEKISSEECELIWNKAESVFLCCIVSTLSDTLTQWVALLQVPASRGWHFCHQQELCKDLLGSLDIVIYVRGCGAHWGLPDAEAAWGWPCSLQVFVHNNLFLFPGLLHFLKFI